MTTFFRDAIFAIAVIGGSLALTWASAAIIFAALVTVGVI